MKMQTYSEICTNKHFNELYVLELFLNVVKLSHDVWEQLGDKQIP